MPRRGQIAKRDVLPDPLYNSKVVIGEACEPVGVVPAGAGLTFLGGDHVIRVGVADHGGLQRGHEASVEADPVEGAAALLQRRVDLGWRAPGR